jgi:hypothetical protein
MMGPAPMMQMDLMSVRLGMNLGFFMNTEKHLVSYLYGVGNVIYGLLRICSLYHLYLFIISYAVGRDTPKALAASLRFVFFEALRKSAIA